MNSRETLSTCLEWFYRALTAVDRAQVMEAAGIAFLHFRGRLDIRDPLVLSCDGRELFEQGHEVRVSLELRRGLIRCFEASGIVCILFRGYMEQEDLLRLIAALRGELGEDLSLDDPEGPFCEARGIRIATR